MKRGLAVALVSACLIGSLPVPSTAGDTEPRATRSGRRYWIDHTEREKERERERVREAGEHRRRTEERQRRWQEWWRERQPDTVSPAPSP